MERILPFKAVRYNKNVVGDLGAVVAPPYDAISESKQQKLYMAHPFNVVRLECGLTNQDDNEIDNRYTRSADTLQEWTYSGVLIPDKHPSIYVCSQEVELGGKTYSCKGIMCLVRLDEFEKGTILPHEETFAKEKLDRLNLMMSCGASFSAVSSLYFDEEKNVSEIIADITKEAPETSVKTSGGMLQKTWAITDEEIISRIQSELENKKLFIAAGHHKYEAAINYRNTMREINSDYTGDEPYNYIMMFLVDMDEQGFSPFAMHRLVKGVVGYSEQGFLSQLEEAFAIEKVFADNVSESIKRKLETENPGFAMYTGKDYFYLLKLKDYEYIDKEIQEKSTVLRHMDVTILHTLVLGKVFGMSDVDMQNNTYLDYSRDIEESVAETLNGNFQCSFILKPMKTSDIVQISLANEKMPRKSTYFCPELFSGMIMNKFN